MAKFKEGDIVKVLEDQPSQNLAKGEIGIVTHYEKDYDQVSLNVLDDEGKFSAVIVLPTGLVKKIGTKIKRKKIEKLWEGDTILVDGDPSILPYQMNTTVAKKIKTVEFDGGNDTLTFTGKDFTIVVNGTEFGDKVLVVV